MTFTQRPVQLFKQWLFLFTAMALSATFPSWADTPRTSLAKGVFLIATHQLSDSSFSHAVVYLTEYGPEGSYGLIVNRPTEIPLAEAVGEYGKPHHPKDLLYFGGPMHAQYMFVLTRTHDQQDASFVSQGVFFAAGMDAIERIVKPAYANDTSRTYGGFYSWGAEQLKAEVDRGDWLVAPENANIIFSTHPDKLWDELIKRWKGNWS